MLGVTRQHSRLLRFGLLLRELRRGMRGRSGTANLAAGRGILLLGARLALRGRGLAA